MSDCQLPPWQPIAEWLARITDADGDRDEFEQTAKAIAYDIAAYDAEHPGEYVRGPNPDGGDDDGEVEVPDGVREQ